MHLSQIQRCRSAPWCREPDDWCRPTLQPPHITRHLQCTAASPWSCNNVGHIARPGGECGKQGRFARTPRPELHFTAPRCVIHVCVYLTRHCAQGAGGSLQYKGYCIALDLHWISISASLFRYTASQLDHMGEYFTNSVELSLLFLTVWPVSTHTYIEHCEFLEEEHQ